MQLIQDYWPMIALALWLGYKWWNTHRVKALLPKLKAEGATLIDVRSLAEFSSGNAPGSVNIPLNELSHRLNEITRPTPVVVGCASGTRSGMAKMILKKNGFKQVYNVGAWRNFIT
jgi:rhodanese-related sulfurtransferase